MAITEERKEYNHRYYLAHHEKRAGQNHEWNLSHRERMLVLGREWHLAHREEEHEKSCAYRLAHREEIKAHRRVYGLAHPETIAALARKNRLKGLYEITLDEYNALLATQGGKCAICGKENSGTKNKSGEYQPMFVDHDHATGKIRGLLCRNCNVILGWMESTGWTDREALLRAYLQIHK